VLVQVPSIVDVTLITCCQCNFICMLSTNRHFVNCIFEHIGEVE